MLTQPEATTSLTQGVAEAGIEDSGNLVVVNDGAGLGLFESLTNGGHEARLVGETLELLWGAEHGRGLAVLRDHQGAATSSEFPNALGGRAFSAAMGTMSHANSKIALPAFDLYEGQNWDPLGVGCRAAKASKRPGVV
jgi:hypothetical protein